MSTYSVKLGAERSNEMDDAAAAYERTKRVYERAGWTDAMCLMAEIARELPIGDPRRVFVSEVLYPRLSEQLDARLPELKLKF